jgi:hypothetical protein
LNIIVNILTLCEALAFITSLIYWRKIKNTYWKWFSFYLFFIVVSECVGLYFAIAKKNTENIAFYNYCVIPIEFIFFILLFRRSFKQTKLKWLPIVCLCIYFTSWLMDIFFFGKWEFIFNSFSFTIGNLLLLILILSYFIQLVTSNAILTFRHNMLFWVSLGLLIYYLGSFPYYGLRNTLAKNFQDVYITYTYIMYVLNCLMYLMFTISFIWGKPNIESSSS